MILPLGDSPNPRGMPVVNYALLAANIAVYLLIALPLSGTPVDPSDPMLRQYIAVVRRSLPAHVPVQEVLREISAYDLFVFRHGFRPAAPHLSSLFASLFLHAGFLHLFGNMLMLWIYGDNVEARLGHVAYLVAYIGGGVAATLFHTLFFMSSPMPLIGASGAISGVLGFYFLWFPRNQVRLLVFFFPFLVDVIVVPARIVLGFFLIADNLLPFLVSRGLGGGTGVAYGAHIGGFIAGLIVAWLMDRRAVTARPAEYRDAEVEVESAPAPVEALRRALASGRYAEAASLYFGLDASTTRRVLAPADLLALADWLRDNGHARAALVAYQRFLRDYPNGPGAAEAHLGAGLVQLRFLGQMTPAYQHFLDALDLDPSPDTAAQARAALEAITAHQKLQFGRRRVSE